MGRWGRRRKSRLVRGWFRVGWAVEDDSTRPLFDSATFSFPEGEKSPWPWVMERPAGEAGNWTGISLATVMIIKQGAGGFCAGGGAYSAAAAFYIRRVVVALLGVQRPGTG